MGLELLTPAFLFGLLGLAIPIAIHLAEREKRERVLFPSLMFLQRIPYKAARRQRLRHRLLLAMRCLALALLALAFAGPHLGGSSAVGSALPEARARVVLLDRSYSMGYGDRFARAVAAAERSLRELQPGDLSSVVTFGTSAEALAVMDSDHAGSIASLESVRLSDETTRFAPPLKLAARLLESAGPRRREVVLISDFQRIGWESETGTLPAGAIVTWVDLSEPDTSNVSITDLTLGRQYRAGREEILAVARLARKGGVEPEQLNVRLELGGHARDEQTVTLGPDAAATVSFTAFPLPDGPRRGLVSFDGDPLAADNAFHFVASPGRELRVVVIERRGTRHSLYLERALGIGDRPRFETTKVSANRLSAASLAQASVAVANDVVLGEAAWSELASFVEAGGGLIVALGSRSRAELGETASELLGAQFGASPIDRAADWGGTLSFLDSSHPAFELFARARSGDFSQARFLRYRDLRPASATRVLARFDDGRVALTESRRGEGRVVVWASSLDTLWNDLPLKPVFLPFVQRLAAYAAGHAEVEAWHRVGDVIELAAVPDDAVWIVDTPSGERRDDLAEGLLRLSEAGVFELRGAAGDVTLVAANVDPAEANLDSLDPEEVASRVVRVEAPGAAEAGAGDPGRRAELWWPLMLVAAMLLAAETGFSNRLSGVARSAGAPVEVPL